MKNLLITILIASLFILISGCASSQKNIIAKSQSTRSDVFVEIEDDEAIPPGYSDIIVKMSIKTQPTGFYLWESKDSFSEKSGFPPGFFIWESKDSLSERPGLPFIFNIDGQASIWKMEGRQEITSTYNKKGLIIPDGGVGMRYILHKKIRLTLGKHRVFFWFPRDECIREFDILIERGISKMDIKPIYRQNRKGIRNFLSGLSDFEVFYNDDIISKKAVRNMRRSK